MLRAYAALVDNDLFNAPLVDAVTAAADVGCAGQPERWARGTRAAVLKAVEDGWRSGPATGGHRNAERRRASARRKSSAPAGETERNGAAAVGAVNQG